MSKPFNPAYNRGQTVTTSGTSARIEIGKGAGSLCLTNTGGEYCYVRSGGSDVVATAADFIIPPGGQVTISKFQDDTHLAYIQLTAATTLNVIPGEGW